MAIRKQLNPRQMDLSPELRDLLMRNGMQAHIIADGNGYQLAVQGHDSPLLTYRLTEKQMLALTDWGTSYANKTAYNTFTSVVGNDFYLPKNFVHARNANGRVAMGLHGYRVELVSMDEQEGIVCTLLTFWDGHRECRMAGISEESAVNFSIRKPQWCQSVGTEE